MCSLSFFFVSFAQLSGRALLNACLQKRMKRSLKFALDRLHVQATPLVTHAAGMLTLLRL